MGEEKRLNASLTNATESWKNPGFAQTLVDLTSVGHCIVLKENKSQAFSDSNHILRGGIQVTGI